MAYCCGKGSKSGSANPKSNTKLTLTKICSRKYQTFFTQVSTEHDECELVVKYCSHVENIKGKTKHKTTETGGPHVALNRSDEYSLGCCIL